MNVAELLVDRRSTVLEEAFAAMRGPSAGHYHRAGQDFTQERLAGLFDLVAEGLRDRSLVAVTAYCEDVAQQRFEAGFGISEVQTAVNALERSMWDCVVGEVPPDELAEAVGLLTTVFGAGKDALARRYVSLAAHRRVPTLDLSAMFAGTDAVTSPLTVR